MDRGSLAADCVIVPVLWELFRFLAILALVAMAGILLVILLMDRR